VESGQSDVNQQPFGPSRATGASMLPRASPRFPRSRSSTAWTFGRCSRYHDGRSGRHRCSGAICPHERRRGPSAARGGLNGRSALLPSRNRGHRRIRETTDFPLTGGCNCGAVRFEVTAPLVRASYCQCKVASVAAGQQRRRTPTRRSAPSGSWPARTGFGPETGRRRGEVVLRRLRVVAVRPQSSPPRSDRHPHGRLRR
jgi:hypothetical protein